MRKPEIGPRTPENIFERENDLLTVQEAVRGEKIVRLQQTFRRAAEELMADKGKGWRNPKHRAQWAATLETYAYPVFGDWPAQDVNNDAVMQVLRPLWDRAPETGSRLRGRIEAVLDAAAARGWRIGENPARWKGDLASRVPSPARSRRRSTTPPCHGATWPASWPSYASVMVCPPRPSSW